MRRVRRAQHKLSVYGFYFGAHSAPYSEVSWVEAKLNTFFTSGRLRGLRRDIKSELILLNTDHV